jgi:hypothetical protein
VTTYPPAGRQLFVPAWATIALNAAGLYGDQVDRDLGVWESPTGAWELGTFVDRIEDGSLVPGFCVVLRLAAMTGVPPAFFYKPIEVGEFGPVFICDRSKRKHGLTIARSWVDEHGVYHSQYDEPSRKG